ncbi:unnamed protein product, partial [Lathyrus oleraceus]
MSVSATSSLVAPPTTNN